MLWSSVYAVLLEPCLSNSLTYSRFVLSCSTLFQLLLDAASQAVFSASLGAKVGSYKCCFKTPFSVSTCVRKRASHEARLFLLLQSVTPLPYSVSSRARLRSQMCRTFLLVLLLNLLLPPPPPAAHTHTNPWSLGLCRNILQVNQKSNLPLLV